MNFIYYTVVLSLNFKLGMMMSEWEEFTKSIVRANARFFRSMNLDPV